MRLALLALFVVLGLEGCATVDTKRLADTAPPAPRPSYAIGHRWIRSDGVWELTRFWDGGYVFTRGDGSTYLFTRDLFPFRVSSFDFAPAPELEWPLAVGKRGATKGHWAFQSEEIVWHPSAAGSGPPRAQTYRFTVSTPATLRWAVEAWEEIRVPAGRFEAFRIVYSLTAEDARRGPPWSLTMWYAPAVRQMVAAEGRNVGTLAFQLLSVDPGRAEPVQLVIREPADRTEVVEPRVVVQGRASAGHGVGRVSVAVNGAEAWTRDEPSAPAEVGVEVPVTLRPARNVIVTAVTDTAGQRHQEARTVFFDPDARRVAVEGQRTQMGAARADAATAEAPRLASDAWAAAALMPRSHAAGSHRAASAVSAARRASATCRARARLSATNRATRAASSADASAR